VPGPEQRRGRHGLFETLQQSSHPYIDGRTLDDGFLECKGKLVRPRFSKSDMYGILQDRDIKVSNLPRKIAPQAVSELIPLDGSLTTRTVPKLIGMR
jgi:hypothetical protein